MAPGVRRAQDRGMQPQHETASLPDLLAEYGRLAAQLPGAQPGEAAWLRHRLAQLDVVIDQAVAALGIPQV